jgi:hypothetical protein
MEGPRCFLAPSRDGLNPGLTRNRVTLRAVRVISRLTEHGVEVFDAVLELVHVVPTPPPARYGEPGGVESHTVASDRQRLVYATDSTVVCVDPAGRERWRHELGAYRPEGGQARAGCAYSFDDQQVWVYVPNVMAGRGEHDEWLVLDAATGALRARGELPTVGQGGEQFALRDGRMLLDVGEGQDGTKVFLAEPSGTVEAFPWTDRVPVAVSPDERQLMTVHHEQEEVAFHSFPGGEVETLVKMSAFADALGPDMNLDELVLEWAGGYLDTENAIVVISGEHSREGDWWRHFRISTRTGEVLGELPIVTIDAYDLKPLGDGTFVITDTDGTLRRM